MFPLPVLLAVLAAPQPSVAHAPPFDVVHYDARLEPDLAERAIRGVVVLDVTAIADSLDSIDLDIGALTIDRVRVDGAPSEFVEAERKLHVPRKPPLMREGKARIEIEYHGAPRFGLEFVPEKAQMYTIFSTSQWLPCVDAPGDKATLRLTLVLPRGFDVVANGRPVATRTEGDRIAHEWRLDEPAPTYTFGFAAGRFNEAVDRRGETRLRYLSTELSADHLKQVFAETKDMLAFFEERSGVAYGSRSYTQALVAKTIGQELEGFSLMSEEYGQGVLNDPTTIGLIAHEFAHQWWGNNLTCRDWTHFWLNEGFATFMAAAYREKRFGREAYLKDVEGWRARYQRVKAAGHDRSLVFPDWNRPTSDDRALVYQKGALVLHELRELVGDAAFWKGMRTYTRAHRRGSVITADFERAMQTSVGKDLSGFFSEWVYLRP